MRNNSVITKTSNEEGKYAELTMRYLSESQNLPYIDVSDDKEHQKADTDAIVAGIKVEIKNDTEIHWSGNAVYETNTHVTKSEAEQFKAYRDSRVMMDFSEIPLNYGSVGCNEKCDARWIYYFSTIEEQKENRRYKLNPEAPCYKISNKDLKEYVRKTQFPAKMVKIVWQQEDRKYNFIICIKIKDLIDAGVAKPASDLTMQLLKNKADVFFAFHTSNELKELLF